MGGDLGQLARLLLYLRFYFELPNYAHVGRPVAKALQMTQIWLRGATIADIKEFLDLAPIPEKSCDELKIELVSFEKAKSKGAQRGDSPGPDEIKLFSHFFLLGNANCIRRLQQCSSRRRWRRYRGGKCEEKT